MTTALTDEQVRDLVRAYCAGPPADWDVLRVNDGKVLCRIPNGSDTAILKLWSQSGWKAKVRRWTRSGPLDREFKVLDHLGQTNILVPRVLGSCWMQGETPYSQAFVITDMGDCRTAMVAYKELRIANDAEKLREFEAQVIELTAQLLAQRVLDTDHSMENLVVMPDGRVTRLDFEVAQVVIAAALAPRRVGEMLGRLTATFAFTVQPDVELADDFARRLTARLQPTNSVLRHARQKVESMLEVQRREANIDTRLNLAW